MDIWIEDYMELSALYDWPRTDYRFRLKLHIQVILVFIYIACEMCKPSLYDLKFKRIHTDDIECYVWTVN